MCRGFKNKSSKDFCEVCGKDNLDLKLQYHHIKPVRIEKDHKRINIAPLCVICHKKIEDLYEIFLAKIIPEYSHRIKQHKRYLKIKSLYHTFKILTKRGDSESLEKIREIYKKDGWHIHDFNMDGFESVIARENKKLEKIKAREKEKLIRLDWKTLYESCKNMLIIGCKNNTPSDPEI